MLHSEEFDKAISPNNKIEEQPKCKLCNLELTIQDQIHGYTEICQYCRETIDYNEFMSLI